MSNSVAEIESLIARDQESLWVVSLWDRYNDQRRTWVEEKKELRDYIFATDTSTTTNSSLPWKNSTTIPKLCQIRDNLHSNYLSSLFPNDSWLKWVGYSASDEVAKKAKAITAYMDNKARESNFRTEVSKLLYDYIDYGNSFSTVSFESKFKEDSDGGIIPSYVGPVITRISPLDVVFNPRAKSFDESFKIVRSVKTLGELKKLAATDPDQRFWEDVVMHRESIKRLAGGYSIEDFDKAVGYQMDGFGNMYEYYMGDYVEVLEFFGDYYEASTGELHTNKIITIVDRSTMVRMDDIPSWSEGAPIRHVGWRFRPDNLWAMGPLDNLVGLQYRLDHLENLKADAMDLIVHPPLKVIGEVEEFVWGPGAEIQIDENGDVQELGKNLNGIIGASQEMSLIEDRMEMYAGAPREAMGVRTPGEKTALEVQTLSNAAGRIFQEKITNFEINCLEPSLNDMLEVARRNLDEADIVRISDQELGLDEFLTITKEDITANGKLRPIGARHFSKQAQDLQNLIGVFNSPIGQMIAPHTSGAEMTKFVNDVTGLSGYNIFSPNVAIAEQQDMQRLAGQAQEDLEVEQKISADGPVL